MTGSRQAVSEPRSAAGGACTPGHDDDDGWEAEAMRSDTSLAMPYDSTGLLAALPAIQRGRAPRMAYHPWRATQGVEVGAIAISHWYWRCPVCRAWSGPYRDVLFCKQDGMDHRHRAYGHKPARRSATDWASR
jgi:hypothetical protein